MSFQERHARYRRLHRENASWQLLRADNAPHILAFIGTLFDGEAEVAFGRARAALDAELVIGRDNGTWESEVNANSYLRQWIQSGWLRELDNKLSITDAANTALELAQSLERRDARATASHLRIVQDAVRDLSVELNPNAAERLKILLSRRKLLDQQIKQLRAGHVEELSELEQRERVRELYQLTAVLSSDFRRVEDEIRELDQSIRVQMIESSGGRGDVINALLDQEELLANTDAGRAFDGFFRLLSDPDRSSELRNQLRFILEQDAAQHLNPTQRRYLSQLMRELSRESDRVFQVRRRTEQSLRGFIERGSWEEGRAIDHLLGQLERAAVKLNHADAKLGHKIALQLPTGNAGISSPTSWRLHQPSAAIDTGDIHAQRYDNTLSDNTLQAMQSVRVLAIAQRMRKQLLTGGPATIATLVAQHPIEQGLEELVAHVRIAQAVGATRLPDDEHISFRSADGRDRRARIPAYLLQGEQFPPHIETLEL